MLRSIMVLSSLLLCSVVHADFDVFQINQTGTGHNPAVSGNNRFTGLGGGFYSHYAAPTLRNCNVYNNRAGSYLRGWEWDSSQMWINGNSTTAQDSNVTLSSEKIVGNLYGSNIYSYSGGGPTGLPVGSPLIDLGNNDWWNGVATQVPDWLTGDYYGNERIIFIGQFYMEISSLDLLMIIIHLLWPIHC